MEAECFIHPLSAVLEPSFRPLRLVEPQNSAELLIPEIIPEIDMYVTLAFKDLLILESWHCSLLAAFISTSSFPVLILLASLRTLSCFDIGRVHQANFPTPKKNSCYLVSVFNL